MKIDLKKLQYSLKPEQIIMICMALGADRYEQKDSYIIFPTICHNNYADEASMKLYYYIDDCRFHCYTECGDTFNIYELIRRVYELRNEDSGFSKVITFLEGVLNLENNTYVLDEKRYTSRAEKYKRKTRLIDLPTYPNSLIDVFTTYYPVEWLNEGITKQSMEKFNIRYSISNNKIIIPHYNVNNELIGIRGRALDQYEIDEYGKYMPVKIENKWYTHPLSQNLYGFNLSRDYIKQDGVVFIFEAEKSCMLYDGYFDHNLSVAVCGSNFNKAQLDILLKYCDVHEIVICFDKEYSAAGSKRGEEYFNKLWSICDRYSKYCNMSFIFDREGLLKEKDSPVDRGKDIFLRLYNTRVRYKEK